MQAKTNRGASALVAAAAAMVAATLFSPGAVRATDYTWLPTAAGTYDWGTATNWDPNGVPSVSGDTANLGSAAVGNQAITLPGAQTITGLTIGHGFNTDLGNGGTNPLIFNGAATISSGGSGANLISAPVQLGASLGIATASINNLTIAGDVSMINGNQTLTNNLASGKKLVLNNIILYDTLAPLTARTITLNGGLGSRTEINGTFTRGDGTLAASGGSYAFVANNSGDNNVNQSQATFVINAPQAFGSSLQRSTYVLNNNLALGTGTITTANGNQANWGCTISTELTGGVTLPNVFTLGNSAAFAGNNDIVLSGRLSQGNNRAMGNMIAAGKSLTLTPDLTTNPSGVSIAISNVTGDGSRTWIFEGAGTTIVNGLVTNNFQNDADTTILGAIRKRGTGRVVLNNAANTQRGATNVDGGILVFGVSGSWGAPSAINVNANGGIAYTPGVNDAGFTTLMGLVSATSNGFLALAPAEAGANVDLSAKPNMSLAGDGNLTYTGTVTPGASGYNWGGFASVLTLGANKSVGANNVTIKNGGTVILTGTQSYTGITTLSGANLSTSQNGILPKNVGSTSPVNFFTPSTLQVTSVANGGEDSMLGASSNAAANLVLSGGTLRYVGTGHSTDRLFTVGNNGGTIDAAGSGALQFLNSGTNLASGTGARTLTLTGASAGPNTISGSLSDTDATTGTLSIAKTGAGKWILGGVNTNKGTHPVSGGVLEIANTGRLGGGAVSVSGGATLAFAAGNAAAEKVASIAVDATSFVDMFDNDMVVGATTTTATVVTLVKTARNGGTWNAPGITSTSARNLTTTGLGVLTGAEYTSVGNTGTFSGQIYADTDTLVKYTWNGDANLDGRVTFDDYVKIDTGFNTALTGWLNGDFNYSGNVSFDDYVLIDIAFNQQSGTLGRATDWISGDDRSTAGLGGAGMNEVLGHLNRFGSAYGAAFLAAVPEPASVGLFCIATAGLVIGRRRRVRS